MPIDKTNKKHLLTPKYDVIFQALFGRAGSEKILGELLSILLQREVKNIILKENQILTREYPNEKLGVLDLVATINDEENINIEIQLQNQYNIEKRILFYWSRIYVRKLTNSQNYKELKKTISMIFLDFEINKINSIKDAHTIWMLREIRNINIVLFKDIEIHIIEMPKILKYNETNERLRNWIQFILNPESEEVRMSIKKDKILNEAYVKLNEISTDEELIRIEELKLKKIWDDNNEREYREDMKKLTKKLERRKKQAEEALANVENKKEQAEEALANVENKKEEAEEALANIENKLKKMEKKKKELEEQIKNMI